MIKTSKPVTSSQRGLKRLVKSFLGKKKALKKKSCVHLPKSGRNNSGSLTVRHKGGGHKKLYREIDFHRNQAKGIVECLEYDPQRTALLARLYDLASKKRHYILAPKNLIKGSLVEWGSNGDIRIGHALSFDKIPIGSLVHNLSFGPKGKGKLVRSAGTYAQLIQKTKDFARVRICSGEQRLIPIKSFATLGVVSNESFKLQTLAKAGRSRWLGKRPYVRGVAMNPVDHPHGGGEGKTSGGRPSVTPWGKPTKGQRTSRSKTPLILVPRKHKV